MIVDWEAHFKSLGFHYRYITEYYRMHIEEFSQDKGNGQSLLWDRINQERWKRNWSRLLQLRWPRFEWIQVYPIPKDKNP